MFSVKYARRSNSAAIVNLIVKARYSRRSDKSTSTYRVVKSNGESLDDVDGAVLGTNSNWELLTPRGFRFYMPGSVGPGWQDVSTTAQVRTEFLDVSQTEGRSNPPKQKTPCNEIKTKRDVVRPMLRCVSQECPILLRKGIEELFPGCIDVSSPQLTIVTISQKSNLKTMRWSREAETETLAKYFVLAASDICTKLKMIGYWADFINPFSGQPHLSPHKNSALYKTDQRFRCLGFQIAHRNNCKVISYDRNIKNFIGSLYTTAPASTEFLREILNDCELVDVQGD